MRNARSASVAKPSPRRPVSETDAAVELAIQRHKAGDVVTAERLYGHVLLIEPHHALCLHNLGTIWLKRNNLRAALDLLEAAARTDARRPLFHCTLGTARFQAGDIQGAQSAFQQAIDLQPGNSPAWDGLGMALRKQEQFDEAIASHRRALKLDPDSRAATRNLCLALIDVGQLEEAERLYERLIKANPLDPDVVIQRGIVRLTRGDQRGWQDYAWSHWSSEWLKTDPPVLVPLPQWDGQPLEHRGLVLYGEQGIGDEIMFASLVPAAAARAARTMVLCEPRLVPLFARSFPSVQVAAKPPPGQSPTLLADATTDERCSLSRLPATLDVGREDFNGAAFLRPDPLAVRTWQQRLAALGAGLKVGISWRGGNDDLARATRSLALDSFAPLFTISGAHFINVQYGNHAQEIAAFNEHCAQPLHSFEDIDPLRDMDGLAAVLCALDLVISVDNSTVHLAGALGVPTWVLCPFNANWRWTQQGETSHWYDSLRLFRQESARRAAWAPVVEKIAHALRDATTDPPPHASLPALASAAPRVIPAPVSTVMLINDATYWSHWGCTGTSLAVHEQLRAGGFGIDPVPTALLAQIAPLPTSAADLHDEALFQRFSTVHGGLLRRMQAASEVVISGAECLRGMDQQARALLYLAWIARHRLGKRTSIINHSCIPSATSAGDIVVDAFYSQVYGIMDFVAVRECQSLAQLQRLGINAVESFDCLPLFIDAHRPQAAPQRERRVILCPAGHDAAMAQLLGGIADLALRRGFAVDLLVGASAFLAQEDLQLVGALHPGLRGRYRLVTATSERQWLANIAGAHLLVSGRFHHSIAAACLGTPWMAAGDAPDIDGLVDSLGLDRDSVRISPASRERALSRVAALLQDPAPAMVSGQRLAAMGKRAMRNFAAWPRVP